MRYDRKESSALRRIEYARTMIRYWRERMSAWEQDLLMIRAERVRGRKREDRAGDAAQRRAEELVKVKRI